MNALRREGSQQPIRLKTDDFEVYRSEFSARSATVLMIDMSRRCHYAATSTPPRRSRWRSMP